MWEFDTWMIKVDLDWDWDWDWDWVGERKMRRSRKKRGMGERVAMVDDCQPAIGRAASQLKCG